MQAGYIDNKPNLRADYTDYYLLNKPARFMGHELVMIEEEYMSRYIGCCVSPGAGLSVKVSGSLKPLGNLPVSIAAACTHNARPARRAGQPGHPPQAGAGTLCDLELPGARRGYQPGLTWNAATGKLEH